MIVINVLVEEAYNDCRIKGSINVPYEKLAQYVKDLPKDTEIVVYCASYACSASSNAQKMLFELGFTHVLAYEGGISEWHQLGYPTEGACRLDYLKVKHEQTEEIEMPVISAQELLKRMPS